MLPSGSRSLIGGLETCVSLIFGGGDSLLRFFGSGCCSGTFSSGSGITCEAKLISVLGILLFSLVVTRMFRRDMLLEFLSNCNTKVAQ